MHISSIPPVVMTVLFVLGLAAFRLLWGASQLTSGAALGRGPKVPKSWRRWLFDEHDPPQNRSQDPS